MSRAQAFADEWIEAWNSHDLDRILSHYSDDAELLSPVAAARLGTVELSVMRRCGAIGRRHLP